MVSPGGKEGGVTSEYVVNFPSMPQEITFARNAQYTTTTTPFLPDGFPLYTGTTPLEIPIKFKVSSFDEFCPNGGIDLVAMAAKLHAMTLPIRTHTGNTDGTSVPNSTENIPGTAYSGGKELTIGSIVTHTAAYPPVCRLELFTADFGAGDQGAGVNCIGYVRSASITLHGPWLTATRPAASAHKASYAYFNVPTSASFDITFVSCPTYRNDVGQMGALASNLMAMQTFSEDVLQRFYNTMPSLMAATGDTRIGIANHVTPFGAQR